MVRVDLASVAFDGLAILTLGSALRVALARDASRVTWGLLGVTVGVAGLYVILSADLLAVMQLLVNVGGTALVLLLAELLEAATPPSVSPRTKGAAFALSVLAGALVVVAVGTVWPVDGKLAVSSAAKIGHELLGSHALPFELMSLVLLTTLVGALAIARPARHGAPP